MIIKDIQIAEYSVPFKTALKTAKASYQERAGILVKLSSDTGEFGLGEVAPLPEYSKESLAEAKNQLIKACQELEGQEFSPDLRSVREFSGSLNTCISHVPSVSFGIESALCDLASKSLNKSLALWLNPESFDRVLINTLLPGDENKAIEILKNSSLENGIFKCKLFEDWENAAKKLKIFSKQLPPGTKLRIDANQAYNMEQAQKLLEAISNLPIEYIEEPLNSPSLKDLSILSACSSIPIALDESLGATIDIADAIDSGCVDVLILKPTILGGILRTIEVAKQAHSKNLKVVLTSTLEAGIGVTHVLHTAVSLSNIAGACGLNTLDMLEDSLLQENPVTLNGQMLVTSSPGIGMELKEGINWIVL